MNGGCTLFPAPADWLDPELDLLFWYVSLTSISPLYHHDTVPSLQVPFPLVRVWGRRGGKEKRDGHPAFLNVGQNKEEPDLAFQHGWHSYLHEKVKSG